MKRIFIFSDSHVPTRANSKLFQKFDFNSFDYIISAGDIVDDNTYFELINQKPGFIGVHGNMDEYFIKKKLPQKRTFQIEGIRIGIIHGHQTGIANADKLIKMFDKKIDIMIFGHSHKRFDKNISDIRVINPGALCDGYYIVMEMKVKEYKINFEKIDI